MAKEVIQDRLGAPSNLRLAKHATDLLQIHTVNLDSVKQDGRIRKDMGKIGALVSSIREFGLIEPIVLHFYSGDGYEEDKVTLVAGGRRLAALKAIGIKELVHAKHFIWREEVEESTIRLKAVELEENLQRKSLKWAEEVEAKHKLYELMQELHGHAVTGKPRRSDPAGGAGFGIKKLAAMLGESYGGIHRDLEIARALRVVKSLRDEPTKESCYRKLRTMHVVTQMMSASPATQVPKKKPDSNVAGREASKSGVEVTTKPYDGNIGAHNAGGPTTPDSSAAAARPTTPGSASQPSVVAGTVFSDIPNESSGFTSKSTIDKSTFWCLYHTDFRNKISEVADTSVDLVYTDLPYGVNLDKMSRHAGALGQYADSRTDVVDMLCAVASESFRILKPDRFAVFWFGFNYYQALLENLNAAGFNVVPVPIIWLKHRASTENPNTRYANAYEAALYCVKGSPILLNPGRHNVVDVPAVSPGAKLQAAQQPLALPHRFIEDMVAPGATVVDLCAGVGTTLEAALRSGCRAIGFERDIMSYEIAKARLSAL